MPVAENGIERVRFLIADSDRFSRYFDDASETVVYQLWLVDGVVREGASGVLTPLEPDYRLYEDHMLAGFYIGRRRGRSILAHWTDFTRSSLRS